MLDYTRDAMSSAATPGLYVLLALLALITLSWLITGATDLRETLTSLDQGRLTEDDEPR